MAIRQLEKGKSIKDIKNTKMGKRLESHVWRSNGLNKHKKSNREALCSEKLADDSYGPKKLYEE